MFSFIGSLFSSRKSQDALVSGTMSALDKLFLTEEEKKDYRAKAAANVIEWQKATTGQNLARRFIALIVVGVWAVILFLATGLVFVNVFIGSAEMAAGASELMTIAKDIGVMVVGILAFYFTPHAVKAMKK